MVVQERNLQILAAIRNQRIIDTSFSSITSKSVYIQGGCQVLLTAEAGFIETSTI